MQILKQVDYRELFDKAAWTFLQGFLAVFILAGESIIDSLFRGDWDAFYVLVLATAVAGVAAGLSALKTFVLSVFRAYKDGVA